LKYKNPLPTVDIIIEFGNAGIILVKRKNRPVGWALPGGFVDYGESLENAAIREATEETSLDIEILSQFHTYSDPLRDPRHHTITTVYIAKASGTPKAADDAEEIGTFDKDNLPRDIVFDHRKIIEDYNRWKNKNSQGNFKSKKSLKSGSPDKGAASQFNVGSPPEALTIEEKKELLSVARKSVVNRLKNRKYIAESSLDGLLRKKGVFVTIDKAGELRGCIGVFTSEKPLYETVAEMACAAAFNDPRFSPLYPDEVDLVDFEISVLSPLKEIKNISKIKVGTHGIYITRGVNSGVLLPQVATEYGWDVETFLSQTCRKALLPGDAWKNGAKIEIFSAQIFGEKEETV